MSTPLWIQARTVIFQKDADVATNGAKGSAQVVGNGVGKGFQFGVGVFEFVVEFLDDFQVIAAIKPASITLSVT